MVKYSCERCGKEFTQKSHYDSHNTRKTPCENNADKIKALVDIAVEEKLKELNNKNLIFENKEVNINTDTIKIKINKSNLKNVDNKLKFIDLFAGTGAFTLVLEESNKFKCVFTNDMMECSKKIYELNNPSHKFTLKDLNTINVSDIPSHNLLCGGFPCFVAGTKVLTCNGYKNIEDVVLIDRLMTHTGQFQKIINLQHKYYNGTLYNITAKYHPSFKCTDEHPFYIREKTRKWNNNLRKYEYIFKNPEWKKANELNNNHYFGMKINENSIIPEFSFDKIINQYKKDIIKIKLDNLDMWFMMGYFIGDGWIEETNKLDGRCMYKIRFAINNKDEEYVVRRINNILQITDKKCSSSNNCNKYGCADKIWFNIFKKFGKYAYGKLIPEWVQDAPKEYIQEFINGYHKSDGCIIKNDCYEFTTISDNLAFGLQRLYLKLGHIFSIKKNIRPKTTEIEGRIVNQRDTYHIRGYTRKTVRKQSSFIENGYVWYTPFKIEKEDVENEPVYNFEVENDNSYVIENIISHNCQPFSIAGDKKGFDDKRSNVFWKIVEILEKHNPEIIILENVKNLKSHDKGNTYKIIEKKLEEIGYHIKTAILDTNKITNIPQHRERIYIVGFRDKEKYDKFNFEFPQKEQGKICDMLEKNVDDKYYYSNRFKVFDEIEKGITKNISENVLYQYRRFYVRENKSNCCPTLTANMGGGGHNVPLLKDDKGIRKLTPRECFNLQGFPKDYKLPDVCDSALYQLAGNAVSVPVVNLIVNRLNEII